MKKNTSIKMLTILLIFSAAGAWAKGRKPVGVAFIVEPSTVTAGHTLWVGAQPQGSLKSASLVLGEKEIPFYPTGHRQWRGLIGFSSLAEPGLKKGVFKAKTASGREVEQDVSFWVEAGTFPVSFIKLSPARDKLITEGKMERDAKVIEGIFTRPPSYQKLWSGYFIMPATGVVTSLYGARRTYGDRPASSPHSGVDIANSSGTLVVAPNRGRVVFSERLESFGHVVVLEHGQGVFSYYLHMFKALARQNQIVQKGAPLGLMGAEGIATGPHVHWSFAVNGERVDALEWTKRQFK